MALEHVSDEDLERLKSERDFTGESVQEHTARIFRENAVYAAQEICTLAVHCGDPRIRMQASSYVVDRTIGRIQDNPPKVENDPYETLINEVVRHVADAANDLSEGA